MAKKAEIISFKEAYSKASKNSNNKKNNSSSKNTKKASTSQKGKTTSKSKKIEEKPKENKNNEKTLSKEEYIRKVMKDSNKSFEVEKKQETNPNIKSKTKKTDDSKKKKELIKKDNKAKQVSKTEGKTKKKPEKINKKYVIKKRIIFVILLILIIIAIVFVAYFLRTSPQFNLVSVNIKPTKTYTIDEIWQKAGIVYGNNIFVYDINKAKKEIETLPYVKEAKISRELPSTISITVIEREKEYVCLNSDNNEYLYISKDGYILEKVTKDKLTTEDQIVSGIIFDDNVVLGSKLNDVELSKLVVLQSIKDEFKKENFSKQITSANFENSVVSIMLDDKVKVIFPNAEQLTYNIRFLKKIIEEIDDVPGTIDMTKPSPSFIYDNI